MRLSPDEHRKHAWRVTTLAPDFELLDVWRYPIELDESVSLEQFIDSMQSSQRDLIESRGAAGALFRLRGVLGKLFGWDDDKAASAPALPIPGCSETSVCERLSDEERATEAANPLPRSSGGAGPNFTPVYRRPDETLLEISNKTVHALMHLGRVSVSSTRWSPQMAVYVKARGALGRHYMSLISPFRHYIVYPTMMRSAKRGWPSYAAQYLSR